MSVNARVMRPVGASTTVQVDSSASFFLESAIDGGWGVNFVKLRRAVDWGEVGEAGDSDVFLECLNMSRRYSEY